MPADIANRRSSPRFPASGPVEILFEDPLPTIVEAQLQETSEQGFRISHASRQVVPGLEVSLRRDGATQRARVIWTHILEGRLVSGCLLL
ncbi:PilZ domain-containing protein [Paludibaculum fermentans]|uniref:PilZ domain-containing protein n=1 Tax=Paludibaculum fermentans TaxID=1473598 RepID=A0A7S7SLY1_PALFE|nr:PilZ domain-containing protein [Paludibaculum fermentans]QOY90712.1 PilZ domain-containing protein [Paludibaculum fermentans]